MYFNSVGKGSLRYRVKNFNLLYSIKLPSNSFYLPNGLSKSVETVFQIWGKEKTKIKENNWYNPKKSNLIKVFTICVNKSRLCGLKMIGACDFYISSTFFKNTKVVNNFADVKYGSGIGIKILNKKDEVSKVLKEANWNIYSTKSTNNCYHIGISHIHNLILDKVKHD
ncbi:hypothetical protein JTY60_00440 [symbiont of Argiope bruennichi]